MLHIDDATWTRWQVVTERQKFFFLRWNELFDQDTFDTWQIRSSNVRSLLQELEDAARTTVLAPSHRRNLKYILDELDVVVAHDTVIRNQLPALRHGIKSIRHEYETSIAKSDPPRVEVFVSLVHIVSASLHEYPSLLFDELERILAEDERNYKIDLHMLCMLLAVDLKNLGLSVEQLRMSARELATKSEETGFIPALREMRRQLLSSSKKFDCIHLVRGPIDFRHLDLPDVGPIDDAAAGDGNGAEFWDQDPGPGVTALRCTVDATDPFAAVRLSTQRVEEVVAFWRLYRPSTEITIHPGVLVKSDDAGSTYVNTSRWNSVAMPRDAKGHDEKASRLIARLNTMRAEDRRHVNASLQYFRSSLGARKQETRLMNLWIALEALFQGVETGSLISHVADSVSKTMALTYVHDISRSVPVDIRFTWRSRPKKELIAKLPRSNENVLDFTDFMWLITRPDSSEEWAMFAQMFTQNPLMMFRLWKLRDGIFKSPSDMADHIDRHRNNVKWQVYRIFRLRNTIAHRGSAPRDISQLTGHLQTYFITVFHDIVHTLRRRRLESIPDILASRSQDLEYLMTRLRNKDAASVPVDLVATGYAECDRPGTRDLWHG